MNGGTVDFRPVDADNHYYEPLDAFTRHLDPKFARRGVRTVRDERQHVQLLIGTTILRARNIPASAARHSAPIRTSAVRWIDAISG